jgi:TRAP-type C4-dicarboxylate transport system substrate-binding protein
LHNGFEIEGLQVLPQHGMEINKVDLPAFRARMQPVFDRFQDRVGKDLIETVRKLGT